MPEYDYSSAASSDPGIFGVVFPLIMLVFALIALVGCWKLFTKAGKPGWAAIIPIYNSFVLMQIIKKPWWWLLLLFIPFVSLIITLVISIELAKAFGKSTIFGVILLWLFPIGILILGFDKSKYQWGTPVAAGPAPAAPAQPEASASSPK